MSKRKPGPLVATYISIRDGKAYDMLQYQCRRACDWYDSDEWGVCNWHDVDNPGLCACDEAIINALNRLIRKAREEIESIEGDSGRRRQRPWGVTWE